MNAYKHAIISQKRRGGKIEDYLPLHNFIDSTKELCSDNRHRILHTMWGIRRVVVPVFGETLVNSDNKQVYVKDICEQDHVLPDYQNKFIPTLSDFVEAIKTTATDKEKFATFYDSYKHDEELAKLLLSPLHNTGKLCSLYITHNSWFINEIVPLVLKRDIQLQDFSISPSDFFNNMSFRLWMDNGSELPLSAKQTAGQIIN